MKKILSILVLVCMLMSSFALAENTTVQDTYTYNAALTEFPTVWDPLRQQTATDSDLSTILGNGLYGFDFNETMDGYVIVPEAAADYPVDVTAEYVGDKWGIAEGETTRAWRVTIREDMKWEDGTPITAADFVASAKYRLNPEAQNYRADSFYSGNLVIAGAEAYAKAGLESDTTFGAYMDITGDADIAALLANHGTEPGYINWNYSFGDTYDFETKTWTGAAEDKVVDSGLTVQELYDFYTGDVVQAYATWASADDLKAWAYDELYVKYTYPDASWDSVGFIQSGDYSFDLILTKALQGFYLYYAMTDTWLVKSDMYDACTTITDGVYNNTYGTTLATTISWGPYKLVEFQSDKIYTLARNEYWYGFNDNPDWYPADTVNYNMVKEASTRHEMFLSGQLETFGLDKDHIAEYATSDYTYYSEGDSVFAMVFNPDKTALEANQAAAGENINKTILTVKDFRTAMSLSLDRAKFILATSPTNFPAFALYGSQIVADPDNGIFYRTTDVAKNVILNFWGLADEVGEGKTYATVDEAIDSISGYNLEMAKQYFNAAYDTAIADGLMDEDDVVQIIIGTPNTTSAFYNNGYDFLVNNYTEAVKGTKLEGKLTFTRDGTLGNGFADGLRNNQVDMLFGVGWTGSTFDPFGLMEAYTKESYQYDPAWDTTTDKLEITLDGEVFEATVWDWTQAISGEVVKGINKTTGEEVSMSFPYSTDADASAKRFEVLGALENCVLMNYDFIPIMADASAFLKSMKFEYCTEDEVFPMARGGLKRITFNYTDAEWAAFIAEQGGTLNYK